MVNITVPQCNIQQMVWDHVVCRKQKQFLIQEGFAHGFFVLSDKDQKWMRLKDTFKF